MTFSFSPARHIPPSKIEQRTEHDGLTVDDEISGAMTLRIMTLSLTTLGITDFSNFLKVSK
jgi:hypothetical protein